MIVLEIQIWSSFSRPKRRKQVITYNVSTHDARDVVTTRSTLDEFETEDNDILSINNTTNEQPLHEPSVFVQIGDEKEPFPVTVLRESKVVYTGFRYHAPGEAPPSSVS